MIFLAPNATLNVRGEGTQECAAVKHPFKMLGNDRTLTGLVVGQKAEKFRTLSGCQTSANWWVRHSVFASPASTTVIAMQEAMMRLVAVFRPRTTPVRPLAHTTPASIRADRTEPAIFERFCGCLFLRLVSRNIPA